MASQQKVVAASGDADASKIVQATNSYVQVALEPVSASGTVTITAKGAGESTFKEVADGAIDLSAPQTVTINGDITAVRATSSGLDYTMIVTGV